LLFSSSPPPGDNYLNIINNYLNIAKSMPPFRSLRKSPPVCLELMLENIFQTPRKVLLRLATYALLHQGCCICAAEHPLSTAPAFPSRAALPDALELAHHGNRSWPSALVFA